MRNTVFRILYIVPTPHCEVFTASINGYVIYDFNNTKLIFDYPVHFLYILLCPRYFLERIKPFMYFTWPWHVAISKLIRPFIQRGHPKIEYI